jgi:AP-2 complex subunit alpha
MAQETNPALSLFVNCSERELVVQATNLMGRYLSAKETNTRYMALEALCNMTGLESARDAINKYQETVVQALKVCK